MLGMGSMAGCRHALFSPLLLAGVGVWCRHRHPRLTPGCCLCLSFTWGGGVSADLMSVISPAHAPCTSMLQGPRPAMSLCRRTCSIAATAATCSPVTATAAKRDRSSSSDELSLGDVGAMPLASSSCWAPMGAFWAVATRTFGRYVDFVDFVAAQTQETCSEHASAGSDMHWRESHNQHSCQPVSSTVCQ